MKRSKDPFEAAIEEKQEESPAESPEEDERSVNKPKTSIVAEGNNEDENEEEEEEENMETTYQTGANPVKIADMQTILSQFTEEQMSRYEFFRRSALHKSNMKMLLQSITRNLKIDDTMNIVVCGIAKMFVGELVETARVVMGKKKESGPIRPCHIRESYRRLKLEGKVPKR